MVAVALEGHIRWMIRSDMLDVLAIEQAVFEYPWHETDFIRCLRQSNCIGMVAEVFDAEGHHHVVGFMVYELHKTRLHVIKFAVAADRRGQGIGRQVVEKLISKLSPHRRTKITLEVRETNLNAQLFFAACGFRATRVLRGYYDDSPEDAYVMEYRVGDAPLPERYRRAR